MVIELTAVAEQNKTQTKTHTTRHIFVTGGVVSSLGKGLTASSVGHLLRARGLKVVMQKLDPYLNVDPGTMNPFQHGEVFVTADGAETDLDIGHYERFLNINLDAAANVTTGQIYSTVIAKERQGKYLGDTVQVIPHITDEIKHRMRAQATQKNHETPDVIITEIGGTVGDIESLPFLEAARQVRHDIGRDNVFFLHVSLIPYIGPSAELKTKPTQHSVATLRSIGIQPDAIVLRSDRSIPNSVNQKVASMCDVQQEAVVNAKDVASIYDIPKILYQHNLDKYIINSLKLPLQDLKWGNWDKLLQVVHKPKHEITVALVGKYVDLPDAYLSVTEALRAGGFSNNSKINLRWVAADDCVDTESTAKILSGVSAICVPGGFGVRGIAGKLVVLKFARENKIPTLALCLGMQCMVVEYARNMANMGDASSTEFNENTKFPVVSTMEQQKKVVAGQANMGGTMRLGSYVAKLTPGSLVEQVYGTNEVVERHRHRYEVNDVYCETLEKVGLVFSGRSKEENLVEFVELPKNVHPYYIGTQAHPEMNSRPTKPHPLFEALLSAALAKQNS